MAKSSLSVRIYDLLILFTSNLRSIFLLAIRLTWGWQFCVDGHGKITHLDKVTSYFTDLKIPMPHANAVLVAITELTGGLFLLAGLGSRFWAAALSVVMAVALITGDADSLHSLDKFVLTDPFPYLFTCVVITVFGPGRYSIDFLIQHFVIKRSDDCFPPTLPKGIVG
jgi:putative oxidoreductase